MAYDLPGGRPDVDSPSDLEFSGSVEAGVELTEDDSPADEIDSGPGPENADHSTEIDEGGFDIGLLDEIERELADVELALDRLGDGSYGRCETCGKVLTDDELDSAPAGRFCPAHLPLDIT